MKKNQLIELLQSIEGNPEIMIWNGLVNDVMHIQGVGNDRLYKYSKEHIYSQLKYSQHELKSISDGLPKDTEKELKQQAERLFKKAKYEYPNPYLDPADYGSWYSKRTKPILVILAAPTGKTHADRLGTITY